MRGASGRWQMVAVISALVALLVTGCEGDDVQPTRTYAEVDARVEQLIREAAGQLPAGAELTLEYAKALPCEGKDGMEDSGQVFAERFYKVTYPESWPVDQVMDILAQFWETRGYRLHRQDRDDPLIKVVHYRDPSDETSVGIKLYPQKDGTVNVFLSGSSVCVWEFGTPSTQP